MSKIAGSVVSGLISRRTYARAAVTVQVSAAAVGMAKTTEVAATAAADAARATSKDKLCWMRDPKTGCWIPENRFEEEVDAVELRNRLIYHK